MDALRDRHFVTYLAANAVSLIGDSAYFVALGWSASQLGNPLLTSIVMAAGSIPRAVLLILGGAVADRYGPRRIMLGSDLLRAVVMAVGAVLVLAAGRPDVGILIGIALVFGIVDAFYMPAQGAFARFLVRTDELPKASAISQIMYRMTSMAGGPVGGMLVAAGDFQLACFVNGATFLIVFCVLLTVRPRYAPPAPAPSEKQRHVLHDLVDGVRYIKGERVLRTILLVATVINLAISPIGSIGIVLRVQAEGWSATDLGLLQGAIGLGGVAGSVGVLLCKQFRRPAFWGLAWILLQGSCGAVLMIVPGLPLTLLVCAIMGSTFGIASAMLSGFAAAITDPAYQGRMSSVGAFSSVGLVPIAYVVFGGLVGVVGLMWAALIFAAVELGMTAWALANPDIRHATMPGRVLNSG